LSSKSELKRVLRQLYLLKLTLYISLVVAIGCTALALAPAIYSPLGFGPAASAPTTQTIIANATIAATTFSYTTATPTAGGYSVLSNPVTSIPYNYYGFTAVLSWMVFGAALTWRGHVRSVWGQSHFSYDTFRLLVKMRGAQTRLKLMRSLNPPKNKLQLATALGIDWKAVDKHVQVLERNGLIKAASTNGTAVFYEITDKGRNLLQVIEQLGADATMP
jgi:predicted transcriptional regulator